MGELSDPGWGSELRSGTPLSPPGQGFGQGGAGLGERLGGVHQDSALVPILAMCSTLLGFVHRQAWSYGGGQSLVWM